MLRALLFRLCHRAGHFSSWSAWWQIVNDRTGTAGDPWLRVAAVQSPWWPLKLWIEWSGRGHMILPNHPSVGYTPWPWSWLLRPYSPVRLWYAIRELRALKRRFDDDDEAGTPRTVWRLVLLGVVIAPLVTWLPMMAHRYPRLGLPVYHPATGIDLWSMQALWAVLLGAVAVFAWRERDHLMALALVWVTIPLFVWGGLGLMVPTHAVLFATGCLLVVLLRKTPGAQGCVPSESRASGAAGSIPAPGLIHHRVRKLLVVCGLFQAAYAIQQRVFNYDLLWGPHLWGPELGKLVERSQPLGTLGTVDALGSFVAITAPLMSPWLLPIAALAVACTKSYTAIAAFLAGVTALCWIRGARRLVAVWALIALVVGLSALVVPWKSPDTFWSRLIMLDFGARLAWQNAPVMGFGLGGWSQLIPSAQAHLKFLPSGEFWREAHNEIAQWGVETGVVGLVLFAAWLCRYRRLFLHRVWGGSAVALAVSSLGFFPFHVVPTALLGLLIVGLGTAEQSPLTSEG